MTSPVSTDVPAALRQLADSATHLGWIADVDGACTYLNPGAAVLLHPADLRLRDWVGFIHPDDRERLRPVFKRVKEERHEFQLNYRLIRSDGSVRWMVSTGAPRFSESGTFLGYVGTILDSANQRDSLARLAQSEETHTLLMENSSDLITHHAPDSGIYLYASPSSKRILGFAPSDLIGTSCYSAFHPDDVSTVRAEIRRQATGDTEERLIEFRHRHKDGGYVWIGAKIRVLLDRMTGEKLGSVVVSRDITAERRAREELRKSEARFRELTSLSSDWYWETDEDGRFTFISDGVHRIFGTSADEVIGRTRLERAVDKNQPDLLEYLKRFAARESFRELRYSTFVHAKGRMRHAVISGEPVYENGVFIGYRGVGRDVTEKIEFTNQLALLAKENKALIENSLDIIALVSEDGRFLRVNGAAREILGYEPTEMQGQPYAAFLSPDELERMRTVDAGLRTGKNTVRNFETRWRCKNGGIAHLSLSVRWSDDAKVMYATARDVTENYAMREELRKSRDRMLTMLESIGDAFFALDRDWRLTYVNRKTADFVGRKPEELVRRILWDAVPEILTSHAMPYYRRAMDTGERVSFDTFWEPTRAWCEVRVYPSEDGIAIYFHDITDRRRAEDAIRASEERFRKVIEMTPAGYAFVDAAGTLLDVNPALCDITGFQKEELIGRNIDSHLPVGRSGTELFAKKDVVFLHGEEALIHHKSGRRIYVLANANIDRDENGTAVSMTAFVTDITERKQTEGRLAQLATHDTLTGLPNRSLLNERLQHMLDISGTAIPVAVLFLDLDRFKEVNDSMGHGPGDQLLNEVARRLKANLRPNDIVARLGGDEFVVAIPCSRGTSSAKRIVEKLFAALAEPMDISGQEVIVRASVGISMYPQDGTTKEVLLQNADIAMYRAKAAGRNGYCFFEAEMSAEVKSRMTIEQSLHHALARNEFELHYQPRLDLNSMQVVGLEALIRWNHPQLGRVPPLDFISLAEERGFIEPIGKWVLDEACRQARALMDKLDLPLRVSVNLSARQLKDRRLVDHVREALQRSDLPASLLELELTESALVEDMEQSIEMFQQLKSLGVSLAVDDFGTGYSGLAYLGHFPLDVLKLDRSFINAESKRKGNGKVIKAFVDMAHALNLSVVAEGVETSETLEFLRKIACDEAQGYLIARPLPADALVEFLAQF